MAQPPDRGPGTHGQSGQHVNRVMSEEDAIARVESAGFTNVSGVRRHGHSWHCNAVNQDGHAVAIVVDGGKGGVHLDDGDTEPKQEPAPEPQPEPQPVPPPDPQPTSDQAPEQQREQPAAASTPSADPNKT